ncbi:MAG: THUMP domain-containing protein [Candidatus Woesearchaeota archaeon]|jgi:23S rRNA G2445 N2-methylase RlmL
MTKVLGITFKGFEDIAVLEIKELIKKKATAEKGYILFSATNEQCASVCYKTQSLRKIVQLFGEFSFKNFEDFKKQCTALKVDLSILTKKTFKVDCDREGNHNFTSQEAAAVIGEIFLNQQPKTKVDLSDSDIIVACIIKENLCYVGIDYAGFDLSKREYKIYAQAHMLNAGFAYCALRYAGYSGKEILVDPLCGVGIIPLEAALFTTHISPRFHQKNEFKFHNILKIDLSKYDKPIDEKLHITGYDANLRNVEAAKRQSKLAGVKSINFARADVEWIDTKAEEKSVDLVIAQAPVEGRAIPEKDVEKMYKELFYQLEFVMKDKGKMVFICQKTAVLKKALEYFTLVEEHTAWQGEQEYTLITVKKKIPTSK